MRWSGADWSVFYDWDSGTAVSKKLDLSSDKLCVNLGNCVIQLMKHVMRQDLSLS